MNTSIHTSLEDLQKASNAIGMEADISRAEIDFILDRIEQTLETVRNQLNKQRDHKNQLGLDLGDKYDALNEQLIPAAA